LQSQLLSQTTPVYPPLAKAARVQGTVRFEALIGTDGHVENLQMLAGPPLLVQASMSAVQQWVWKPTLLNGNPVEVITTVDVNFTLQE
jgi:protein TonB